MSETNRRSFLLASAGAAVAAPAFARSAASGLASDSLEVGSVSPTVVTAATAAAVTLYNKLKAGNQTAADVRQAELMLGVLNGVLRESGFHQRARKFVLSFSANSLREAVTTADLSRLAAGMQSAGAQITLSDLQLYGSQFAEGAPGLLKILMSMDGAALVDRALQQLEPLAQRSPLVLTGGASSDAVLRPVSIFAAPACGGGGPAISFYSGAGSFYLFVVALAVTGPVGWGIGIASGILGALSFLCS